MKQEWQIKEDKARIWLSNQTGVELIKDQVMLGHDKNGIPLTFEFDIASKKKSMGFGKTDEREIVGMVKTTKWKSEGPEFASVLGDCFLLSKANSNQKYMILTDKEMFENVKRRVGGFLDGINLTYLDPGKI